MSLFAAMRRSPKFLTLFGAVLILAGSFGPALSAQALTMQEIMDAQTPQVLGAQVTDLRQTNIAKQNFPGGFSATPSATLTNGNYSYTFTWGRAYANRNGYIYISEKHSDGLYYIVAKFPNLTGSGTITSDPVFAPGNTYRISYYSKPYGSRKSDYVILRSNFIAPDSASGQAGQALLSSPKAPNINNANSHPASDSTANSTAENLVFVIPDTYPSQDPNYLGEINQLVNNVNAIYGKNTSKQFNLQTVLQYDPAKYCDLTLQNNECYQFVSSPPQNFLLSGAISVFYAIETGGLPQAFPPYKVTIPYNKTTGLHIDPNGPLAHELGHTFGLGFPELYYIQEMINGIDPQNQTVLSSYNSDPMLTSIGAPSDQFGPLDSYIINHDMDHSSWSNYWGVHYFNLPSNVKAKVVDQNNNPVSGATVKVFCRSKYVGILLDTTGPKFSAVTDGTGQVLLQHLSGNDSTLIAQNPGIFDDQCYVQYVTATKSGYSDSAKVLATSVNLEEAKLVNGQDEYDINVQLNGSGGVMPTPTSTPNTTLSTLSTPADGSTLAGSSQTFTWTPVTGAPDYWLDVGNSKDQGDISAGVTNGATSRTVSNLPTDGRTLYIKLWTNIPGSGNNGWGSNFNYYTVKAFNNTGVTTLSCTGTNPDGSQKYPTQRCSNNYSACMATKIQYDNSCNITGATYTYDPTDCPINPSLPACPGQVIETSAFTPAILTSPASGSSLTIGSPVTFSWTPGFGADNYWLDVGTQQDQGNISAGLLCSQGPTSCATTSRTVTIPSTVTSGQTIYIKLWTHPAGHNYSTYDSSGWGWPGSSQPVYNYYSFKVH